MRLKKKIAFIIHDLILFDHWRPIFDFLEKKDFEILVEKNFYEKHSDNIKNKKLNFKIYSTDKNLKEKYLVSISNHHHSGETSSRYKYFILRIILKFLIIFKIHTNYFSIYELVKKNLKFLDLYLPLKVAKYNYRFSYGAELTNWQTNKKNEFYNGFFVHGPFEKKVLRNKFPQAIIFPLGYPKYNEYFTYHKNDILNFKTEFKIQDDKKNILYMPTALSSKTHCEYSSLNFIINNQEKIFSPKFNFLIRLHPMDEQYYKKIILKENIYLFSRGDLEMQKLFSVTDYVMCDFGGTPFGSCYLDKKIIFVNVFKKKFFNNHSRNLLGESFENLLDFSEFSVEKYIESINWESQKSERKKIRELMFYDRHEVTPKTIASNLKKILNEKLL